MITLLEQAVKNIHDIDVDKLIFDIEECMYYDNTDEYLKSTIDIYDNLYKQLTSATTLLAGISLKICKQHKLNIDKYEDYKESQKNQ